MFDFDVERAVDFKEIKVTLTHINIVGKNHQVIGVFPALDIDFRIVPGIKKGWLFDPIAKIIGFGNRDEAHEVLPKWGVGLFEPLPC